MIEGGEPPKDSISGTSSSRQTGRIGRNFSESSRGPHISRLQKIDIVIGEEKSLFPTPFLLALIVFV